MLPKTFQVHKVTKETYDTYTVELLNKDSKTNFIFKPGQFNMIYVFGVGEVPISISSSPKEVSYITHTTRSVGVVTNAINALHAGDIVGIRGPFGSNWPLEKAIGKDVIVVAGGIGLAPLRPVIYHLLSNRDKYKKVTILYGTRTPLDILYKNELEKWKSMDIYITVDRTDDKWNGNIGVVTTLIPQVAFDPKNTVAMLCGPEIMMRFTIQALQSKGISDKDIYISMERNMKCAIGFCGHCQFGPAFICKDGPVFCFEQVKSLFSKREI
ncbi:MAG: FAD/NAD(P)-binding protein [Candidatus Melainabacteria bacterium]|nr:FAD/NAD(P)-binding protein [Candidatus Melainabacteria bacterium]